MGLCWLRQNQIIRLSDTWWSQWILKVVKSNKNPILPVALYLSAIKEQGLCPNLSKTDCASENGNIAAVHCFLTGSNLSHRYGASHANQRIENCWSHFKRSLSADFLQCKLDEVKNEWNLHTIRYTEGCQVSGIPNQLYYLPELKRYAPEGHQLSEANIILLIYYNKGILKKCSNRSWKEVKVS